MSKTIEGMPKDAVIAESCSRVFQLYKGRQSRCDNTSVGVFHNFAANHPTGKVTLTGSNDDFATQVQTTTDTRHLHPPHIRSIGQTT